MVEPLVEPNDNLSYEELRAIPQGQRGKFMESAVLTLINVNGNRGLSMAEIERVTHFPKNTMLKHIELLFCKRKIHKLSRGKFGLYFPNGQLSPKSKFRDIMYGNKDSNRYGLSVISNVNGKFAYIQERELDENGFPEDIGGVLIPIEKIQDLINMLMQVKQSEVIVNEKRSNAKWQQ